MVLPPHCNGIAKSSKGEEGRGIIMRSAMMRNQGKQSRIKPRKAMPMASSHAGLSSIIGAESSIQMRARQVEVYDQYHCFAIDCYCPCELHLLIGGSIICYLCFVASCQDISYTVT